VGEEVLIQYLRHMQCKSLQTVWTPANEYATTAAVERQPWRRSRDIEGKLGLPQPGSSKYFVTINCIHTITCGVHICFQPFVVSVGCEPHIGNLDYCKITTSVYLEIYWKGSCFVVIIGNNYVDVATRGHWLSRHERSSKQLYFQQHLN
jgi:hypothetical protein